MTPSADWIFWVVCDYRRGLDGRIIELHTLFLLRREGISGFIHFLGYRITFLHLRCEGDMLVPNENKMEFRFMSRLLILARPAFLEHGVEQCDILYGCDRWWLCRIIRRGKLRIESVKELFCIRMQIITQDLRPHPVGGAGSSVPIFGFSDADDRVRLRRVTQPQSYSENVSEEYDWQSPSRSRVVPASAREQVVVGFICRSLSSGCDGSCFMLWNVHLDGACFCQLA